MLHPALSRALATAHIEELHRAAARRQTIGLVRRLARSPRGVASPRAGRSAHAPRGVAAP
jgi:hypothetical protein